LKYDSFLFFLLFFLTSSLGLSKEPADLHAHLQKIIDGSKISHPHLGIYVAAAMGQPATNSKAIFELNSEQKFIPASITKLVTSAMVLEKLPPGTKLKTDLLSDASIENGTLKGNLYLRGGGDPSFVSETMWVLVNSFLRTQVKIIEGDIVVDDTLFDPTRFDSSRQDVRVDRAYDAPTGAMSFNWNSVNIFVRPSSKSGEPAAVFADPENDYVQLKNEVKTVGSGGSSSVSVEREGRTGSEGDLVIVKGKIPVGAKEVVVYKNITRPDLWSGFNLRQFLHQRGIEVHGKIRSGTTPAAATVLADVESKSIEHILSDMNKFSNNFVAEMLAKGAAATVQKPGTIAKAMDMEKDYLLNLGIKRDDFELKNPSGLTRDNRLTAHALWKVLADLQKNFEVQPEMMSSLPISGIDGTLKKRMKGTIAEREVRAKTGFLTGVVSLAGYASRKDGRVIPFVMMYNGSDDEGSVRALFDRLCLAIVE
jgi:D-alanyl-D-alanine carboxypeptidase/D-alanyl-D-alanine-endopeptidase (penicillin-binding protein 4)